MCLVYFPIQLQLENHYGIYPIDRLENVEVNQGIMKTMVDFEFIKIVDEKHTYSTLFGFEQANENEAIINLKKGKCFLSRWDKSDVTY